jgi:hypothetical protein
MGIDASDGSITFLVRKQDRSRHTVGIESCFSGNGIVMAFET